MTDQPVKIGCKGGAKERILHAAVTLFARQGFNRTGMRALAEEADVNLAMINYFFGTKKKLLTEILDIFFAGYLEIAETEFNGEGDLYTRMENFITSAISFFDTHTNFLLVAITELHHDDPEITGHKAAWARQMIEILDSKFCQPLANVTGREISPKLIAPLLTSMMASRFLFSPVMEQVRKDTAGSQGIEEYSQTIAGTFLQGIAAENILCKDDESNLIRSGRSKTYQ